MPYIPTAPFQQLITPSNFIGPSQPTDTILSLLGPHIDTTGMKKLSLPDSSAFNAQKQQRLLLPPPSVTLPIQDLSEPFTTPPSTSLNLSAADFDEGQADLRVASPIDEDRASPIDEDRNPLMDEDRNSPMDEDRHSPMMDEDGYSFTDELATTLNTAFTGDFPNDSDRDGDDSDESPKCRNPRGVLLVIWVS
jgi:hypothetical protein